MAERTIEVDLGDGLQMAALVEQHGPEYVAAEDIVATLGSVTGAIERVGRATIEAAKNASPAKATVELSFGLALEQGALIALLGKGKADASITVTLEWSRDDATGGA